MNATPETIQKTIVAGRRNRYVGEVVYMFAFDVAYEMTRHPVRELLGQPVAQFVVDASRRNPRHLFFYRPQMVRLPAQERLGPHGPVRAEFAVKLLPVGAISITVRVPFAVAEFQDLVVYHDLQFSNGSLAEEVRRLAEQVRHELNDHYIRPVQQVPEEEAYTVFCMEAPVLDRDGHPLPAESWLKAHRRQVAALLTQEPETEKLSVQESEESTTRALSYYEHDLVVVDWDAALVIDKPNNFDEPLYVMELANLQTPNWKPTTAFSTRPSNVPTATWADAAPAASAMYCANYASCASISRASAMSCRTSPSSSATGMWRGFTRPSPRASIWVTGIGPSTRRSRRSTTSTSSAKPTRTTA